MCDAGEHGWELVAVVANSVAYLKREVDESGSGEDEAAKNGSLNSQCEIVATAHCGNGSSRTDGRPRLGTAH